MNFEDRFPPGDFYGWMLTVRNGGRRSAAFTAQTCEQCGVVVEYDRRGLHHDEHEMIARATATS